MRNSSIKAIILSGVLLPSALTYAIQCDLGLNDVSVTCVAKNGITEDQFPKQFGAKDGTDCNLIPTPATDPNFPNPHWRVSGKAIVSMYVLCVNIATATHFWFSFYFARKTGMPEDRRIWLPLDVHGRAS